MKHNELLALVLPTNEPEVYFKYFGSDYSLSNLVPIRDYCTICLNFQPPWTKALIDQAINKLSDYGFTYSYTESVYDIPNKGEVPINKIRNDTAKLSPKSLVYALVDDDFYFRDMSNSMPKSSGEQFLNVLHYMITNPQCGIVTLTGTLFKKIPRGSIGPVSIDGRYINAKGFFSKNLKYVEGISGTLLPDECLDLVGSDEERVIAGALLSTGYYPARMGFTRISHYENHSSGKVVSGELMYGWNDESILDNNNLKFIRDNYNPDYVKSKDHDCPCSKETYERSGGVDTEDPSVVSELTTDYLDLDKSTIYNILNKFVEDYNDEINAN